MYGVAANAGYRIGAGWLAGYRGLSSSPSRECGPSADPGGCLRGADGRDLRLVVWGWITRRRSGTSSSSYWRTWRGNGPSPITAWGGAWGSTTLHPLPADDLGRIRSGGEVRRAMDLRWAGRSLAGTSSRDTGRNRTTRLRPRAQHIHPVISGRRRWTHLFSSSPRSASSPPTDERVAGHHRRHRARTSRSTTT